MTLHDRIPQNLQVIYTNIYLCEEPFLIYCKNDFVME